jgi:hypothetical protein
VPGCPPEQQRKYPPGSVGDGYERSMHLRAEQRKQRGVTWGSEQHSRDDWPRAWKHIEPLFGDCDPKTITPEMLFTLRCDIADQVSEGEAYRVIKVWRALWKNMATFGYCVLDADPGKGFTNAQPSPRQEVWREGEAVRLIKAAWRHDYRGLAACLAVAWDTQLSPVDARTLKLSQLHRDPVSAYFKLARAKTGRGAIGTLSPRADRVLRAYLEATVSNGIGDAPIFRKRSGRPYSKDTLGDDFRDIRARVFGAGERRQMADFRRTGTVGALAGGVDPETLSSKMANSLLQSNFLHKTYAPVQLVRVRDTDAARKRGRSRLRDHGANAGAGNWNNNRTKV